MSQLLIRFSKFSLRKDALIHKRVRSFSSSVTCRPYLTLGSQIMKHLGDGSIIGDVLLFDPAKEELVTFPDKKIPEELAKSTLIGSSRRWGVFCEEPCRSVWMSDAYNPLASKSNPKMIPLPPLTALPYKVVRNLAISSPPEQDKEEEDYVIAIKFSGSQLSMYRHGHDLRWTNLQLPFSCLDNSNLIFSKRDQCFYLPAPGGNYLFSWDLHFKEEKNPKFRELVFRNLPDLPQSEYRQLDSCSRAEHWVESSSTDEHFLVKWYSYISPLQQRDPIFMVFREEETMEGRYMCYTEDIGDLCIFLSGSDSFCVPASSCPGLKPNSIYVVTLDDVAVYDLATKTCRQLEPPKGGPLVVPFAYWLPPLST